eukprot:scaffold93011_cov59-Phaeocystis_antarctica.AAC.2
MRRAKRSATIAKTTAPAVSRLTSPKLLCAPTIGHFFGSPRSPFSPLPKSSGGVAAWRRWYSADGRRSGATALGSSRRMCARTSRIFSRHGVFQRTTFRGSNGSE